MNCLTISKMSTRNTANLPGRLDRCTEFQLHGASMRGQNIIDFTERKLLQYAAKTSDKQQKAILVKLIDDYRDGTVAVAWRNGMPVPIRVTKDV